MIRILLADDHALVRAGIRSLIKTIEGATIVGEAASGHAAVEMVRDLSPDVVLMDIAMGASNGLDATSEIRRLYPDTSVIIISMYVNEAYVEQALRAGASGYLLKDAENSELERALKAVAAGRIYLCPRVSTQLVENYLKMGDDREKPAVIPEEETAPVLSARQREVLQCIARGLSTKEAAQHLGISHKTVEVHRTQLMNRLNIHDIAGLVRYAIRNGIATLDT